jgi:hypothetical protein
VLHEAFSKDHVASPLAEAARITRNADGQVGGIDPAPPEMNDLAACRTFPSLRA